jgi:hypothetical protein
MNDVINTLSSSLGESPGGLFIGEVRGSGNNVQTAPPNCPIYIECKVMRVLQPFYTFNYFTQNLSDGNACPFLLGLRLTCHSDLWPH